MRKFILISIAAAAAPFLAAQIFSPVINSGAMAPPKTNLVAWYQASKLTGALGSKVSSWTETINGYNATQGTSAQQPLVAQVFGHRSVQFQGAQALSIPTVTVAANNYSVFIIGCSGNLGAPFNQLQFDAANVLGIQQPSNVTNPVGYIKLETSGVRNSTVGVPLRPAIWGGRSAASKADVIVNAHTDTIVASPPSTVYGSGLIGAFNTSGSFGTVLDMYEVLIYNAAISDADLAKLKTYASQKYGINYSPTEQVVFDGNSLTIGVGATGSLTYPQQAMLSLPQNVVGRSVGISGYTTQQLTSGAAAKVDALYSGSYSKNVLAMMEVRNDLATNSLTATQLYNNYVTYCQARQAAGWKMVAVTIIKSAGVDNSVLGAVNTSIRANWATFADALADPASDSRLDPALNNADYSLYIADHVHLTSAGYLVFAGYVTPQILALL